LKKIGQKKNQTMLDKIDLKVIDLLQKEIKTLTLQEIANKTGEAPKKSQNLFASSSPARRSSQMKCFYKSTCNKLTWKFSTLFPAN
jgi:hypothetical protein